ncbi:hypothetical protein BG015_001193 [Linnemannia schmuckeri]|uniref:Uncharacterized protein n=1 Tax=Linnemannia schmuckeri TaxID=64567 RepID=A0A9P5VDU2_9FUNG|nr:hypothetical protein BG015_001193 [Linnemannia schmuckeri]
MLKSVLMLALCATVPFAQAYEIHIWNNAGKKISLPQVPSHQSCICLKNTETAKIYNKEGGNVKLFFTDDCTGNYSVLFLGKTQNNAQQINSLSIGGSGIPSSGPLTCPNYFDIHTK